MFILPFAGSVRDGTHNSANWILLDIEPLQCGAVTPYAAGLQRSTRPEPAHAPNFFRQLKVSEEHFLHGL